jgi:hypothetical protein
MLKYVVCLFHVCLLAGHSAAAAVRGCSCVGRAQAPRVSSTAGVRQAQRGRGAPHSLVQPAWSKIAAFVAAVPLERKHMVQVDAAALDLLDSHIAGHMQRATAHST